MCADFVAQDGPHGGHSADSASALAAVPLTTGNTANVGVLEDVGDPLAAGAPTTRRRRRPRPSPRRAAATAARISGATPAALSLRNSIGRSTTRVYLRPGQRGPPIVDRVRCCTCTSSAIRREPLLACTGSPPTAGASAAWPRRPGRSGGRSPSTCVATGTPRRRRGRSPTRRGPGQDARRPRPRRRRRRRALVRRRSASPCWPRRPNGFVVWCCSTRRLALDEAAGVGEESPRSRRSCSPLQLRGGDERDAGRVCSAGAFDGTAEVVVRFLGDTT